MIVCATFAIVLATTVALLAKDPVLWELDSPRYQHVQGTDGLRIIDLWGVIGALAARYNPDTQNAYHLFTRKNPTVSQPLILGRRGLAGSTNFDPQLRTVVLLHGWQDNASSDFNAALVPAFLAAEDVNVVVVDWSAGADTSNYFAAVSNTVSSGESVARFIDQLNLATGATAARYHILGHSLGGHQAGIVGRNVAGTVSYITAIDPASPGWILNDNRFRASDGAYTEVIHTDAGLLGYLSPLGDADFYPNGGTNMPGCSAQECNHARGYFYMAESLTSGGFMGRQCSTYADAMSANCNLPGTLPMGGLVPKNGTSGVFYLETNASSPFSQG